MRAKGAAQERDFALLARDQRRLWQSLGALAGGVSDRVEGRGTRDEFATAPASDPGSMIGGGRGDDFPIREEGREGGEREP